ncbi:hypothetical protein KAR91_52775 [Candidatus Pacearchaeota archaeon]|nr:hypothetical protein [Candidatus Pacearchaeota archaeon]
MAQFYASIKGNRGEATRMGTKSSGISGHIRGWSIGCRVRVAHIDGQDIVQVYKTAGSNGYSDERMIAQFSADEMHIYAKQIEAANE